ncbi:nucleotidyltransferase family protein [Ramlibacter sp. 2FC]|uniref:nucleotidyltransferase family protein n=1 Tax=Ramlibacter sp. 2FC TaxID=2502188 RepID=UPI0010F9A15A|nr:nucleotidyltransferase family protein [Ramlibacter sp. 2FC]
MRPPTILVLAAGSGSRFTASGGQVHKLAAELHGKPLLEHLLDAVRASGLSWHLERGPHPGMGDSIAAALRATADADGWLILPADLPLLRPETLLAVAAAEPLDRIAVPVFEGRRGHPVRFPAAFGPALMQLSGPQGAAALLRQAEVIEVPVDDPGCQIDVDTLADLEALRQRVRS